MDLYKNGYVVAVLNTKEKVYDAWPLENLQNNEEANMLTGMLEDKWFTKYNMQEIVPDLKCAKDYFDFCRSIYIPVELLLFESLDNTFIINDEVKIREVLGFDCIGNVYYSYLQTEGKAFNKEGLSRNIQFNKNGLLDSLEDALFFIKVRKEKIAAGANIEDFWKETPVRISIIDI